VFAALLLTRNIWTMLTKLPDEAFQGAIFRIHLLHVPCAFTCFLCFFMPLIAAIAYLSTHNLKWDALRRCGHRSRARFGAANLVTGMIWARIIWASVDLGLAPYLHARLLAALRGYLVLRDAIEEPDQRARLAAVMSILSFQCRALRLLLYQVVPHPASAACALRRRSMDSAYRIMLYLQWLPILIFAIILITIRMGPGSAASASSTPCAAKIHAF